MRYIISSRHAAAIEFIRKNDLRFAQATVIAHLTGADVDRFDPVNRAPDGSFKEWFEATVAGNIPLLLAQHCEEVVTVEFTGAPPRGQEYDLVAMEAAGARLASYRIHASRHWQSIAASMAEAGLWRFTGQEPEE